MGVLLNRFLLTLALKFAFTYFCVTSLIIEVNIPLQVERLNRLNRLHMSNITCIFHSLGTTLITHDHLDLTVDVGGQIGGYHATIEYQISTPQLKALADLSETCRQYLTFICSDFAVWSNNEMRGWWVNIHGQKMNNWGGVATSGTGCACAEDKSRFIYIIFVYKLMSDDT